MNKIKQEKPKIEHQMNKPERLTYKKLTKDGKEVFRGNGFPDFYHMEDDRLVVDEVKSEGYSYLSDNQKRLKDYLIRSGVRYRIWNVDKSGDTKIVYDSDDDEKKNINEDKMWDIWQWLAL